jgi:hypothetical protein
MRTSVQHTSRKSTFLVCDRKLEYPLEQCGLVIHGAFFCALFLKFASCTAYRTGDMHEEEKNIVIPVNFEPCDDRALDFMLDSLYQPGTVVNLVHAVLAREEPNEVYHGMLCMICSGEYGLTAYMMMPALCTSSLREQSVRWWVPLPARSVPRKETASAIVGTAHKEVEVLYALLGQEEVRASHSISRLLLPFVQALSAHQSTQRIR